MDIVYKVKKVIGSMNMWQLAYTEVAKAMKQLNLLAIPDRAIADAQSAQLVGKGSLCRVKGTSLGYLTFGPAAVAAPTISTTNTIETPNDYFMIVATDDYVRTSTAMRIEVIAD
jgi:hypothetical protein